MSDFLMLLILLKKKFRNVKKEVQDNITEEAKLSLLLLLLFHIKNKHFWAHFILNKKFFYIFLKSI